MENIKACNKCGEIKPHNAEYFTVKSSNKNGFSGQCKLCEQKSHRDRRAKIKAKHSGTKRTRPINPSTNQPWQKGEINTDGLYCWGVKTDTNDENEYALKWLSLDNFIPRYCAEALSRKKRAFNKNSSKWNVDITRQELIDVFPYDMKCPIYQTEMTFIAHRDNSIQLDRIDCTRGYVSENVAWISAKANRNKSDANSDELYIVANWLKKRGF